MKDELKAKFFKELAGTEIFQAQLALEDETYNSWLSKMLTLPLSGEGVALEYAKCRGVLEVLKGIKSNRERLTELARSRQYNS